MALPKTTEILLDPSPWRKSFNRNGLYRARVVNVNDPQGRGRVQVRILLIHPDTSPNGRVIDPPNEEASVLYAPPGEGIPPDALPWAEPCLTGDTKVCLLKGGSVAIRDLVGVEEFWVYSMSKEGRVVPGRGHSARLTKKATQVLEVTLDNGKSFRCTPDHKLMMRDGSYKEASACVVGESLMPLYRWMHKGYEVVRHMDAKQGWQFTHQAVIEGLGTRIRRGWVVHHKNTNPVDNDPINLEYMEFGQHRAMHLGQWEKNLHSLWKEDWFKEKMKSVGKRVMDGKTYSQRSEEGKKGWVRFRDKRVSAIQNRHDNPTPRMIEARGEGADKLVEYSRSESGRYQASRRITEYNKSPKGRQESSRTISEVNKWKKWKLETGMDLPFREWREAVVPQNHKIVSIRDSGVEDVYDISVDEHHNFAIEQGVFVHNCFPWGGNTSPTDPDGLKTEGFFALPSVGSTVWVGFEMGHTGRPVWLGSWLKRGDLPEEISNPSLVRILKTPGGHLLLFDDTPGASKILLASLAVGSGGAHSVRLLSIDDASKKLTLRNTDDSSSDPRDIELDADSKKTKIREGTDRHLTLDQTGKKNTIQQNLLQRIEQDGNLSKTTITDGTHTITLDTVAQTITISAMGGSSTIVLAAGTVTITVGGITMTFNGGTGDANVSTAGNILLGTGAAKGVCLDSLIGVLISAFTVFNTHTHSGGLVPAPDQNMVPPVLGTDSSATVKAKQ